MFAHRIAVGNDLFMHHIPYSLLPTTACGREETGKRRCYVVYERHILQ
jgi:hypothetical protein